MNAICQLRAANSCDLVTHETEVVVPDDDLQGNYPSLRSRPAQWLCVDDAAIAVKLWVHDAIRNYAWDADSHLMNMTKWVGATESGGPDDSGQASGLHHLGPHHAVDEAPSRTTTSRFVYDALHRRVGRVKDDGEVTVFVYEGWNVIEERTVRGGGGGEGGGLKLGSRYVWGEDLSGSLQGAGGIGGLLSSVQVGAATGNKAEGTPSFFHYDSNGNVILLTDGRGRESARYSYDAFGKTLTATGPAAPMNRYRFSTKPVEEESGLVYYGYRYYDPVTGRWPSRDPIGELGGVNVYGMVGNSAVFNVDRFGLSWFDWNRFCSDFPALCFLRDYEWGGADFPLSFFCVAEERNCNDEYVNCGLRGLATCLAYKWTCAAYAAGTPYASQVGDACAATCAGAYKLACDEAKEDCEEWNTAHGF